MINYSDFDNEYNKKIFLEMYKDEKKQKYNEIVIEKELTLEDFDNYIKLENGVYKFNLSPAEITSYELRYKYIQNYVLFLNFNLDYSKNNGGLFSQAHEADETELKFFTLSYRVGYYNDIEWDKDYNNVKETINFVTDKNLKCSKSIENLKYDYKILNEIRNEFSIENLKNSKYEILTLETIKDSLIENIKKIKNVMLIDIVYSSFMKNENYRKKLEVLEISEIKYKINELENELENDKYKINELENKLENEKYKIIETMGIFLAIFSIININLGGITKESAIFSTISIIISMIVLFGLINIKNIVQLFKKKDNKIKKS